MIQGKASDGKSHAGNPHARFDEENVALAETQRRGSLLYKTGMTTSAFHAVTFVLAWMVAAAVNAVDYTPSSASAGETVEINGNASFPSSGDYNYDIRCTSMSKTTYTLSPSAGSTYNFNGKIWSDSLTDEMIFTHADTVSFTLNFNKPLSFPSATWHSGLRQNCTVNFNAPVCFDKMTGSSSYTTAVSYFHDTNTVNTLVPSYSLRIELKRTNAFPTAPVILYEKYCNSTEGHASSGYMNLHGFSQVFNRIQHRAAQASGDYWTNKGTIRSLEGSSKPATITLNGTDSASTSTILMDAISIVWNPVDNYTQTFVNRNHTTSGDLIVSNGTLEVGGTATFKSVGRIVVANGGRFLLNTSAASALIGVTNVVVEAGGTFEIASGATPFTAGTAILDYETGAAFKLPAGDSCDFAGVTLDGEPLDADTYHPGGALPGLTGGDIIARDFPVTPTTATWDGGAAPDDSIAAPENWTGDAVPALTGGGLVPTFGDSGTRADIDRNVDWSGAVFNRNFTVDGTGTMTLRTDGLAVGANCTNTLNAAVKVRGNQEWNIGAGGRLNVNADLSAHYGADTIHKTGPGELWLNAPSKGVGPFKLGSTTANGGQVVVNTSTNAFGEAADHEVRIIGVTGSRGNQGSAIFRTSTVVERPFVFEGNNVYNNFIVDDSVTVRFTREVTSTAAMRPSFGDKALIVCEGGATLNNWTCFSGQSTAQWRFCGNEHVFVDYFYLPSGPSVYIDTTNTTVNAIDFTGGAKVTVAQPYGLGPAQTTRIYFRNANAQLTVVGDQLIGYFDVMKGGTITSTVPSTVYFKQSDDTTRPITNEAVNIAGAVTLYKRGASLYVQDCAATTAGGIGVGEGTLRMTANAKFPKATKFYVEGTGRAEIEAENSLGKNTEVFYDDTATLSLAADQRARALYVNGRKMPSGIYGSTASGAPNKIDGFEGAGKLVVVGKLFYIAFR